MWDLRACAACLATDVRMFSMSATSLLEPYQLLTGRQFQKGDGMPKKLCWECAALVHKFSLFRHKCERAYLLLQDIYNQHDKISEEEVQKIDRKEHNLSSNLLPNSFTLFVQSSYSKQFNKKMIQVHLPSEVNVEDFQPKDILYKENNPRHLSEVIIDGSTTDVLDSKNEGEFEVIVEGIQPEGVLHREKSDENLGEVNTLEENAVDILDVQDKSKVHVTAEDIQSEGVLFIEKHLQNIGEDNAVEDNAMNVLDLGVETEFEIIMEEIQPEDVFYQEQLGEVYTVGESANKVLMSKDETEVEVTAENFQPDDILHTANNPQYLSEVNIEEEMDVPELEVQTEVDIKEVTKSADLGEKFPPKPQKCKYSCEVCSMPLRNKQQMDLHYRTCHPDAQVNTFMCETCGGVYKSDAAFRRHNLTHSAIKRYKCEICEYACLERSSLLKHIISRHSDVRAYVCDICGKSFKTLGMLNAHKAIHIRVATLDFKCDLCPRAYNNPKHLKTHKRRMHSEPRYFCDRCNRGFTYKSEIEKHLQMKVACKLDPPRYTCPLCSLKFEKIYHCMVHHYSTHKDKVPSESQYSYIKVHVQGKRFEYLAVLKTDHTTRNYKIIAHKCKVCMKSYSTYGQLYVHYRSHQEERHFKCAICNKGFNNKTSFNAHMLVHNKKTHKCDICKKSFKTDHAKQHHMQMCEEKRHICDKCEKRFMTKGAKTNHMRHFHFHAYKDQVALKSDMCEKKFLTTGAKTNHIRQAHFCAYKERSQVALKCDMCEKRFMTKGAKTNHIRHVHFRAYKERSQALKSDMCVKSFMTAGAKEKRLSNTHLSEQMRQRFTFTQCTFEEKQHKCHICEESFTTTNAKRQHIFQAHLSEYIP